MKKTFLVFSSLFLILLTSCGQEAKPKNNEDNMAIKKVEIAAEYKNSLSEEQLDKQRQKITVDNIENIFYKIDKNQEVKGQNKVEQIGIEFIKNLNKFEGKKLTENINGGISLDYLNKQIEKTPENLVRDFVLMLNIYDKSSNKKIDSGVVYVNGVKIGEFKDGYFEKNFKWIKGIEYFHITIRNPQYGDGFVTVNSLNSKGSLLLSDVYLNRATIKTLDFNKDTKLKTGNMVLSFDTCDFSDRDGNCFTGKAKAKVNFISGKQANDRLVSVNMRAITKEGEAIRLKSGGMAFMDIYDENGDTLVVSDGKKVKITYKVTPEDIKNMAEDLEGVEDDKEGYWLYNKKSGVWEEKDAEYSVNKKNNTWTAEIKEIY